MAKTSCYTGVSVRSKKNPLTLDPLKNRQKMMLVTGGSQGNGHCVALDSFKFHLGRGHLRLCFSDGQGRELEGRAVMPMVVFASDLVAEVVRRKRGQLRGLSVDLGRGILRATVDGCEGPEFVCIDGPDFESSVRPNSGSLIEWAEYHFDAAR